MIIPVYKLKHALDVVAPSVGGKKAVLPNTANVLIQDGRVMATNLEIAISVELPEAEGEAICMPYSTIANILQFISGTENLNISVDGPVKEEASEDGLKITNTARPRRKTRRQSSPVS